MCVCACVCITSCTIILFDSKIKKSEASNACIAERVNNMVAKAGYLVTGHQGWLLRLVAKAGC